MMTKFDGEAFGRSIVDAVNKKFDVLKDHIADLEKQLAERNDVKDALIDRDGNLILTMSNGATKSLGPIIGKDGSPGRDGLDLSHLDINVTDDGRGLSFVLEDENVKKSFDFVLPSMIYQGVHEDGRVYVKGDTVTSAGSLFVCVDPETNTKPGTVSWRLAAKRGRDAR